MTEVARALYEFFSGFGIPAYVEDTVPDDAQMPYITYRLAQPDWFEPMSMYARVWCRSTSFTWLANKVDEIAAVLQTGKTILSDGGHVILLKDSNFAQYMPDPDDNMVKSAYLSFVMHATV